ncbi:MAG: hypothetical protein ABEJ93_05310 [Candidatus Nanohalobium sp.]
MTQEGSTLPSSRSEAWSYLEERFGVERQELEEYQLEKISGDFWLVSRETETELDTETKGIRFLRDKERGLKPTTYALQFLGDSIERNVVEVSQDELLKLARREEMIDRDLEEDGYVALKFQNRIVGCGFYKNDKVSSRIPKGRSKELSRILEKL